MFRYIYFVFYSCAIQNLMKQLFLLLILGSLSAQVRIGEIKSITSSLNVKAGVSDGNNLFLATSGGLGKYNTKSRN